MPKGSTFAPRVLPHHPDDHALYLHLIGVHHDRLHRRVGRLQADPAVLVKELLERDIESADERNHHFAVVGRLAIFDDDEIAVADLFVDHRIALDAKDVAVAPAAQALGDGDRLVARHGFDGESGGHVAEHRQLHRPSAHARGHELDRTASVPRPPDEPLLLQVRQMLVHRSKRREAESPADLFQARRVPVLPDELVEVVENLPLTFGKRKHVVLPMSRAIPEHRFRRQSAELVETICEQKAKINSGATLQHWTGKAVMTLRMFGVSAVVVLLLAPAVSGGAAVSRQQADSFAQKIALIEKHGTLPVRTRAARRTPVSEGEVNSWFTYHAGPVLPDGVTQPTLTIVNHQKVIGSAIVDLDAVAKSRASGRMFDIWNLIGGRVPVTVSGTLRAGDGRGRFDMEEAEFAGIPVPRRIVQELVDYYSRTPDHPKGVRLDEPFELPAGIRQIDLSPGAAVVVQ